MKNIADITLKELAAKVGDRLLSRNEALVTAESCTGGWVSMLITSIAGSSAWFDRGFVTYSNEAKQEMLAVDKLVIEIHGAVSEEVARHMVQGAVEHSQAQAGLSVTGIAGPAGGTVEKPVGTVCFGWLVDDQCETETCYFSGDREQIREQSVRHVLTGMLARLERENDRG
ncbi:MAG: nicotinamide-nucleotide amidohydrolase family protein [Planctomycetia bacterium]|nr:nicotinamide-nucleotide amidohydrolase family protein [Planctomycetia bacterium]